MKQLLVIWCLFQLTDTNGWRSRPGFKSVKGLFLYTRTVFTTWFSILSARISSLRTIQKVAFVVGFTPSLTGSSVPGVSSVVNPWGDAPGGGAKPVASTFQTGRITRDIITDVVDLSME